MGDMIRVRVCKKIPPHEPGDVVSIAADHEGTPLDHQWQRRFKDAETDGCCEVIQEQGQAAICPEGKE